VVEEVAKPAVTDVPLDVLDQFAAFHAVGDKTDAPPTQYAETKGRSVLVVIRNEPPEISQLYSKVGVFASTYADVSKPLAAVSSVYV
jgi:hypothetical protein